MRLYKHKSLLLLMPLWGTLVFIILYFIAAQLYPGGSQADKNAVGFSWINNYWCNLLNDQAMNGQPNAAKPVAMAGMGVLCFTLAFFWLVVPFFLRVGKKLKIVIQVCGVLAMTVAFFLFTNFNHDWVTNGASVLGLVATGGTFTGLYKNGWYKLFYFGLFNILFVFLNNYVYYTQGLLVYLPVIQKLSFASFLLWVCCIDIYLYRTAMRPVSHEVYSL